MNQIDAIKMLAEWLNNDNDSVDRCEHEARRSYLDMVQANVAAFASGHAQLLKRNNETTDDCIQRLAVDYAHATIETLCAGAEE